MKKTLLDEIGIFLLREGYTIKNLTRTCFDLLARKNENILLIKVLEDANSITREYSDGMRAISSYINASPLIISEKAGDMLENNVIYTRFDIYTLNFKTFLNCINTELAISRYLPQSQLGWHTSFFHCECS